MLKFTVLNWRVVLSFILLMQSASSASTDDPFESVSNRFLKRTLSEMQSPDIPVVLLNPQGIRIGNNKPLSSSKLTTSEFLSTIETALSQPDISTEQKRRLSSVQWVAECVAMRNAVFGISCQSCLHLNADNAQHYSQYHPQLFLPY